MGSFPPWVFAPCCKTLLQGDTKLSGKASQKTHYFAIWAQALLIYWLFACSVPLTRPRAVTLIEILATMAMRYSQHLEFWVEGWVWGSGSSHTQGLLGHCAFLLKAKAETATVEKWKKGELKLAVFIQISGTFWMKQPGGFWTVYG